MRATILDRLAQRVSLKTDVEETRLAIKIRKALLKIKYQQKGSKIIQKLRGGLHSMGACGVYVKDGDLYSRRVVVKARYVKNYGDGFKEKVRAHLEYISRDNAGKEANRPELFSHEGSSESIKNIVDKFNDAPHNFRFIISPEDGDKLNMKDFTIDLIKTIEKDLSTKLEWVASCHYDTNEPHVHLVINGKNEGGKKLLMTRDYISRGIRNRSAEIINNKLGLKDLEEIRNGLELDVKKNKKCSIDKLIRDHINDGLIDLLNVKSCLLNESFKDVIEKRLRYLQCCGLVNYVGENKWKVKIDYLRDLHQLNRVSNIIEKISTNFRVIKDSCEVISKKSLSEKSVTGRVVARGHVDEIDDAEYLVIKTERHKHIYVELEKYSEKSQTKVGDFVRIDVTKPFEGPKTSDRSIDKIAKDNGGLYDAGTHEEAARKDLKLPPGVSTKDFVQVHLNRLEVLARMGLVKKLNDKIYVISTDYLEGITAKAQASIDKYQPHIKVTRVSGLKISTPKVSQVLKL